MPITETLFLVSLIAPPSPAWEEWTKAILSIAVPLLTLSGGLFYVVWRVFRSGKDAWTTLAVEFMLTDGFDKAVRDIVRDHCLGPEFRGVVNEVRKEAEWRFETLMRKMIAEHNDDTSSHYTWRHGDYSTMIASIQQRLFDLEKGK